MNLSTFKKMRFPHKSNKLPVCATLMLLACFAAKAQLVTLKEYSTVATGAAQFSKYVPTLAGKKVAILTNVTGVVGSTSIVDTLLALKVNIKKIFGPEHGFRGDADAGEKVGSNTDPRTGIPVISLYGNNKKPSKEQLSDIDVLIYDIQDVGVRFYTYISTMCYAMEACAESNKEFIVLDRPNPNGFYVDGPVMKDEFRGFLGLHKVPLVYGMTCGEYARMANAEGWLKSSAKCRLTVITMQSYDRSSSYRLPVKPSPNLPNAQAVLLYPSLGLFEGTIISVGRGTEFPFQVLGHPEFPDTSFFFTPVSNRISREPKYMSRKCSGADLRNTAYSGRNPREISLQWLFEFFQHMKKDDFFDKNFNYHSGNRELQEQVKALVPEKVIRRSWQNDIDAYMKIRKKYLLYPDFK